MYGQDFFVELKFHKNVLPDALKDVQFIGK